MFEAALITGANRGLGLEFAKCLQGRAKTVFAGYRSPERSKALLALAEQQSSVVPVVLDVEDDTSIAQAYDTIATAVDSLDLLINNAGISIHFDNSFHQFTREEMVRNFDVNVAGPHMLVRTFLPLLRKSGRARVANISSGMGSIEQAGQSSMSYRVSKAALNMLSKIQAEGLRGDRIIVVSISPGWMRTDMGGRSAPLDPADSAEKIIDLVERLTPDDSGRFVDREGKGLSY